MPSCSRNPSTMVKNGKESSSPVNMRYLPDDILLNCLARVSRLYYPTLSLVSKRFRYLLALTELYETRTLLGSTESCLYVCLSSHCSSNWFTNSRKPTRIAKPNPYSTWSTPFCSPFRILKKQTRSTSSSGNLLVSVSAHNVDPPRQWISTTVGSNIYVMIGGRKNREPSSRVFVMDCRSHTWHEAPSMLVAKKDPLVCVVDGKIYVVEKSTDCDFSNVMEFFDPKTQIWKHVPSPSAEIRGTTYIKNGVSFEGKLYLLFEEYKCIVYKPEENKWDVVGTEPEMHLLTIGLLLLEMMIIQIYNVPYVCYPQRSSRKLKLYDIETRSWRDLKGLEELPKLPKNDHGAVRLEKCGGKLAVLWEENVRSFGSSTKEKKIWCAEIAFEGHNGQDICGKVIWCDVVLVVPKSCQIERLLFATI